MEESAKRRERLKAMRVEADQSEASPNFDNSPISGNLSNPFAEPSSTVQEGSPASARFDFYTDPMAAFSGIKRKIHDSVENSPKLFSPEVNNGVSPASRPPSSLSGSGNLDTTPPNYQFQRSSISQRHEAPSPYHGSGPWRSPIGMASSFPGHQETLPRGFPFQGTPPGARPYPRHQGTPPGARPFQGQLGGPPPGTWNSPLQGNQRTPPPRAWNNSLQGNQAPPPPGAFNSQVSQGAPLPTAWNSPHQGNQVPPPPGVFNSQGNQGNQVPPSPGAFNSPLQGNQGTPPPRAWNSPFPGSQGTPPRAWNRSGGTAGRGYALSSSGSGFHSSGYGRGGGSPSPNPGRGSGQRYNNSPNVGSGQGGGRGRGRGHGRGFSARERPDRFYNKSMVEDPWKDLVPVVRLWLPKSIGKKKDKPSKKESSSSGLSLAEYLAAAVEEAGNVKESCNERES